MADGESPGGGAPAGLTSGGVALAGATLDRRAEAHRLFFERETDRIPRLCHCLAERFARGGRLIAIGRSPAARSDVRHITVEFVHPVIVGKRALPAIGLTPESGPVDRQAALVLRPDDIAVAFDAEDSETAMALDIARERGCLTLAFGAAGSGAAAAWRFDPPTDDPFIRQELIEVLYHLLWELSHVFFEHRGLLADRDAHPIHDSGASSFLYPFLGEREHDLDAVLEDVRRSVLLKAEEVAALRRQTLDGEGGPLRVAARTLRNAFDRGGTALVFGNGGSATDAMDFVADLRFPPHAWPSRPALDLTEDTAILTALANDVGAETIFSRQIIAHGRAGDVAVTFSTSGTSRSIVHALAEARRRGLVTIAFVGYDGGTIAADGLADHLIVSRSPHIPRIQEAHASAYHVLREWVEEAGGAT